MTKQDMGGQAFPRAVGEHDGATLWDYYAAAALTGLIASGPHDYCGWIELASDSAGYADAMLAERQKRMG